MMGKYQLREEIWGSTSAPASATTKGKPAAPKESGAAEDSAAPPAEDTPQETAEAEQNDPQSLRDLSRGSIAETFRALSARAQEDMQVFEPTLAALNTLVSKCQDAGLTQIGVEQAGFDTLREFKLIKESGGERPLQAHYAILSIDDARILVRVLPGQVIDCYHENINKPHAAPRYLDNKTFWQASSNGGQSLFRRFDLSQEEGRIDFVQTVLITAAATGALQALRQFDAPARQAQTVSKKNLRAGLPKPE